MTNRRDRRDERREPDDQREQEPLRGIDDPAMDDPEMDGQEQRAEMSQRTDEGDRPGRREDQRPDEPRQPRRAG